MKVPVKYLWSDKDRHGNTRLYVKVPGQNKVRIREEPGTTAFMTAYTNAVEGKASTSKPRTAGRLAKAGSLRWLMQRYFKESANYLRLNLSTQRVRRSILEGIAEERFGDEPKHGDKPFALMDATHVLRIRDAKLDFPEAANSRVKALRQLFKWAAHPTVRFATGNPAQEVDYFPSEGDGWHTWTLEEVVQYVKRHPIGTKAYLALALLMFTGVRRSDVVRLGEQMNQNGVLTFKQVKGKKRKVKELALPILPQLRAAIDSCPSGHLNYLVTAFGKPFTANGFGNWFKRRCREAGLDHCSAHGLRKAGACIAVENGGNPHQLMAIFGWDTLKEAERYTRKVSQRRLVEQSMHLLVPERDGNEILPLSAVVAPEWEDLAEKPKDINDRKR